MLPVGGALPGVRRALVQEGVRCHRRQRIEDRVVAPEVLRLLPFADPRRRVRSVIQMQLDHGRSGKVGKPLRPGRRVRRQRVARPFGEERGVRVGDHPGQLVHQRARRLAYTGTAAHHLHHPLDSPVRGIDSPRGRECQARCHAGARLRAELRAVHRRIHRRSAGVEDRPRQRKVGPGAACAAQIEVPPLHVQLSASGMPQFQVVFVRMDPARRLVRRGHENVHQRLRGITDEKAKPRELDAQLHQDFREAVRKVTVPSSGTQPTQRGC